MIRRHCSTSRLRGGQRPRGRGGPRLQQRRRHQTNIRHVPSSSRGAALTTACCAVQRASPRAAVGAAPPDAMLLRCLTKRLCVGPQWTRRRPQAELYIRILQTRHRRAALDAVPATFSQRTARRERHGAIEPVLPHCSPGALRRSAARAGAAAGQLWRSRLRQLGLNS